MKPFFRRPRPLVIAAALNIALFGGAIVAALAPLPASAQPSPRSDPPMQADSSSEDPPPLTPILDPKPEEPRPVQQIVHLEQPAAMTPRLAALGSATAQ